MSVSKHDIGQSHPINARLQALYETLGRSGHVIGRRILSAQIAATQANAVKTLYHLS